jgi:hypothetical protein
MYVFPFLRNFLLVATRSQMIMLSKLILSYWNIHAGIGITYIL